MAETSSTSLYFFFSSSFPPTPTITRSKLPFCPPSSTFIPPRLSSSSCSSSSSRLLVRSSAKDSDGGDFTSNNPFSFYPWDSFNPQGDGSDAIEWVQEERVTLFTADGIIQIGGSLVPRQIPSSDKKQGRGKTFQRFQRFQEQDYMDPNQGLCLGALFDIAATNVSNRVAICFPRHISVATILTSHGDENIFMQGLDMGRRLCIFGFCRSIEMLSDVVEDAVLEHGGEVVAAEKASDGGLQEKLIMTVAVPLLWGVPPASETLHFAVRSGGGIVEKVYWQWDFL
ncbi:uncharacterized protein LOC131231671 isoform X1 [Magnolia sinica]|uniref:uncharacterized protein LOC131231671 isoform X1 n=1 Tax=Magnolia sinica TaxID=86752 RepID=UPI002659C460|nr:uncharacterized protein LOC131231671 isoform X1 [Magnolia sinica]